MARSDVIITPDELMNDTQVLDVRWRLGQTPGDGRAAYVDGHIPGARFLDFDDILIGPKTDPLLGRHPLPDAARVSDGLAALGVDAGRPIVVYDMPGSFAACRAWWVLTWTGLDVRVLDGGWGAWLASGRAIEAGPGASGASGGRRPRLTTGRLPVITAQEAAAWPGTLIDARAAERFRGEVEPLDRKAGHIPGAVNRPVTGFWADDGTLPDDETLRDRLGALREPVAAYCGSGVSATRVLLALAALGIPAALYPPSWSGWSADPARPVATG